MKVQIKIESQSEKAYKVVLVYNNDMETKTHFNTWMPKSVVESINENNIAEVKDWFLNKLFQEMASKRIVANFRNAEKVFSL